MTAPGVLFCTALLFLFFSVCTADASAISPASLLQSAKSDFQAGRYASASAKYEDLLGRNLNHSQLREVLLTFCESALREGKLPKAESLTVLAKELHRAPAGQASLPAVAPES